jgi:hypothetical protein
MTVLLKIQRFFKLFPVFLLLALNLEATIFDQKLDFKEGIVHYQLSENGSKTLYIKEYGKKRVIFSENKNSLLNSANKKITYITPEWIYELNLDKNHTTKIPNINYLLSKRFEKLTKKEQKQIKKNLDKKNITENILGYACNLESIDGIATYKAVGMDLVLKSEIDILGFHSTTIATEIEKKEVDSKIFDTFKNLKIKEDREKSQELQKKADSIITSLLKPKKHKKKNILKKDTLQQIIEDTADKLDNL